MSKQSGSFRKRTNGTVLFTVVTVMFMLMLLILATLTVSTAAKTKAYDKFAENQAYYTARSLLELGDNLANYDKDFNIDVINLGQGGSMDVKVKLGAAQGRYFGENTKITVTCKNDNGTPVTYQTNPTNVVSYVPCTIQMTASCDFLGRHEEVSKIYTTVRFTSTNTGGNTSPNPGNSNNAITAFNGGSGDHQFKSYGGTSFTGNSGDFLLKGNTSFVESAFFDSTVKMQNGSGSDKEGLFFFPGNNFVVDKDLIWGNDSYPIHVKGNGGHMYINGKLDLSARQNKMVFGGESNNENADGSYMMLVNQGIDFGNGEIIFKGPTYIGNTDSIGLDQKARIDKVKFMDNAYVSGSLSLGIDPNANINGILQALASNGYGNVYATGPVTINGKTLAQLTLECNGNEQMINSLNANFPKPFTNPPVVGSINPSTLKRTVTIPQGDGSSKSDIYIDTKYSVNMSYYKRDANGNILNTDGKPFVNGTTFTGEPAVLTAMEMANISDPSFVTNLSGKTAGVSTRGNNYTLNTESCFLKPSDLKADKVLYLDKSDGNYNIALNGTYSGTIYVAQGASVNFYVPDGANVNLNKVRVVYGDMAAAAGFTPDTANGNSNNPIIIDNRAEGKRDDAVSAPKVYLFTDTNKDITFTNESYFQGYIYAPNATVNLQTSATTRKYSFTGKNFSDSDTMSFDSDSNVVGSLVCGTINTSNTNGAIFVYNGTGYSGGGGGGGGGGGSNPDPNPTPLSAEEQAQLIIDSNGTLWRSFYIE